MWGCFEKKKGALCSWCEVWKTLSLWAITTAMDLATMMPGSLFQDKSFESFGLQILHAWSPLLISCQQWGSESPISSDTLGARPIVWRLAFLSLRGFRLKFERFLSKKRLSVIAGRTADRQRNNFGFYIQGQAEIEVFVLSFAFHLLL